MSIDTFPFVTESYNGLMKLLFLSYIFLKWYLEKLSFAATFYKYFCIELSNANDLLALI